MIHRLLRCSGSKKTVGDFTVRQAVTALKKHENTFLNVGTRLLFRKQPNDQGMSRSAVFRAVGSMPLLASNRQGTPLCFRIHKPPRVGKVIKLIIV